MEVAKYGRCEGDEGTTPHLGARETCRLGVFYFEAKILQHAFRRARPVRRCKA